MKKTLTQLAMLVIAAVISFNASAQNRRQQSKSSNQKFNVASSLLPGSMMQAVNKNAPPQLFTSAISGYYLEDFEGATFPPAGWQALDILDPAFQWEQSVFLPFSGLNSAYCPFSGIGIDGEDWLILPQFTVAATDSFSMWFAVAFTGFPPDSTFIRVSTTDSLPASFTNVVATLAEGLNYPTTSGVYQYYSYDLSAFAGQDVFIAIQNKNTYGDGIYVDKVTLGTKPAINAASISIDIPASIPEGTMSPMATFKNDGLAAQSFPVTMTTLAGYTSTQNITSLAPGATQQVTFDPWTTSVAGVETVTIVTQLAGDGYTGDDSLTIAITVLPATNALPISIDLPNFIPVGTMSPMATFKNDGVATQTFPVTMTTLAGYTSTQNITNLAAGATQQVTFDPWTTTGPGIETVSVVTQLAGDENPADDTLSASIPVLDTFTNYGWVSKAPMITARFDAASAAVNGADTSYLYATCGIGPGGASVTTTTNKYLPYSNSWIAQTLIPTGEFTASAAYHANKIYVIGGFLPGFVVVPDNQVYDVAAGTWSAGAAMPIPVGDYALGIYNDSLFYYFGGYDGASGDRDIVQIYNPATNAWTTGTNMPIAAEGIRGAIMGNKIIVTTGYSSVSGAPSAATYIGDIDVLNPSNITWTQGPDYPAGTNFRAGSGASLDEASGLVIFTAGEPGIPSGAGLSNSTFAYDFNSGSWKIGPDRITSVNNLCNFTAIVDNDSLWMASIGGYDGTNVLDINEWLNMGPYIITTGIDNNVPSTSNFSSYPNPFAKSTEINFSLSNKSSVQAIIIDVLGNRVEELCNKNFNSGNHTLTWNAAKYSKGIYFCKLIVNGKPVTQKLLKY